MKTDKLSITLSAQDFPNPEKPMLWIKTENATVTINISKYGIDLVSWIDKKAWPNTKVSKKTYRF